MNFSRILSHFFKKYKLNFYHVKDFYITRKLEIFLSLLIACILLITSWNADDAYHTFVISRNLANGNGFVYNIGERVLASTSPLFSLILSGVFFITNHMSISASVICTLFSTVSFYIVLVKFADVLWKKIAIFFIFILAQGFFSFANCGLENCLLFFLETIYLYLILSVTTYNFKRLFLIALVCSFLLMTRLDTSVLIFVPTAYIFLSRHSYVFKKCLSAGFLGLLPFFCFAIFCIFYFGFLFPNTYYAKLNSGYPQIEYFERGLEYIWVSALYDPFLISIIILAPFFLPYKTKLSLAILAGIILKFMYIIYIGGDFMVCRFLSDFFWYNLCLIIWFTRGKDSIKFFNKNISFKKICIAFIVTCSILTIILRPFANVNMFHGENYSHKSIADERAWYWSKTSTMIRILAYFQGNIDPINSVWEASYRELLTYKTSPNHYKGWLLPFAPGILVYKTNEDFYEQDTCALGDPLLARLPAIHNPFWRIGHMKHQTPDGYSESLKHGKNEIVDPNLHEYYDIILSITRGKLFSLTRVKHIILFNLGKYDYLVDAYIASNR